MQTTEESALSHQPGYRAFRELAVTLDRTTLLGLLHRWGFTQGSRKRTDAELIDILWGLKQLNQFLATHPS